MNANRSSHLLETLRSQVRTPAYEALTGLASTTLRGMAVYEWLLLGYTSWLLVMALGASGPDRERCLAWTLSLFTLHVATVLSVRGGLLGRGAAPGVASRVVSYGVVQSSYFVLRWLLPAAVPWSMDEALLRFDLRWFGAEPAIAWDSFVTPATTEWFAFFYFSYFVVMGVHIFPILFGARDDAFLSEFTTGFLAVMCVGQATYFLVPAFGPVRHLAHEFHHALPHGTFMGLVLDAVAAGGAQKDVFPSLHTAAPTFIALFSYRHRARMPFRLSWPVAAFFAGNIVIATMFLRWHYLIDIVAGLLLASTAVWAGARVTEWERARRDRLGVGPAWPSLLGG